MLECLSRRHVFIFQERRVFDTRGEWQDEWHLHQLGSSVLIRLSGYFCLTKDTQVETNAVQIFS